MAIDDQEVRFCHVMHTSSGGGRLAFFFAVHDWVGEPENREPDKCSRLAWFSLGVLPLFPTAERLWSGSPLVITFRPTAGSRWPTAAGFQDLRRLKQIAPRPWFQVVPQDPVDFGTVVGCRAAADLLQAGAGRIAQACSRTALMGHVLRPEDRERMGVGSNPLQRRPAVGMRSYGRSLGENQCNRPHLSGLRFSGCGAGEGSVIALGSGRDRPCVEGVTYA